MFIYISNRNMGKRNPRVPVVISGQSGEGVSIGPTVWVGFGPSGIYQGVGFHTTVADAKRIRQELDKAITIAERS
jgi:hypothetical protein